MASDHLTDSVIKNCVVKQSHQRSQEGWLEPAVWVRLHPSWLFQLSPPQEGACKHHATFVIIKSFHSPR